MRSLVLLALLPAAAPVFGQVVVGPNGVRVGGTRVDSSGVHTGTTDVTSRGVVTGGRGGTVIRTNGNTRTVDCRGGSLSLDGNGNHLDVTRCSSVAVNGNSNVVAANFPSPGRLQVVGNRNRVNWRSAPGVRVAVTNLGTGNGVVRR